MKRIFIAIAFLAFFAFQLAAQAVTSVTDISVLVIYLSMKPEDN